MSTETLEHDKWRPKGRNTRLEQAFYLLTLSVSSESVISKTFHMKKIHFHPQGQFISISKLKVTLQK